MNNLLIFFIILMMMFTMIFIKEEMFISLNLFNNMIISMDFKLSIINMMFSMVVMIISLMVKMYSKIYFGFNIMMKYKINLMYFIVSMIFLINSNSFLSILIGWDGLGISSFFLVSFYSNEYSSISSLITFFFNRLGDCFMMIFFCLYINFSTKIMNINLNMTMMMFLILGLITKSSQIPFGVWLPMAMSAPTPVSSLVHSSTLVTAGILVMMKMNNMYFIYEIQTLMMLFGIMTFFLGGLFSIMILDMKKTVAFSTLSQLGFIMISLSMGNYMISYYHLVFHAFFKSLLFINLGFMMMMNYSIQDFRMMNLFSMNIFFKMSMNFSIMNLMGMILLSGFISKDMIMIFFMNNMFKFLLLIIIYISCFMTVVYSMKIMFSIIQKKLYMMKIYFSWKMNFYYMSLMLISMMILFIPNMMINMLELDMEMYLTKYMKLMLYGILLFSIFLFKFLFFSMFNLKFYLSSMIMILDLFNYVMFRVLHKMNLMLNMMMMMEDMFQLNIFMKMFNWNMSSIIIIMFNINMFMMMMIMMNMIL